MITRFKAAAVIAVTALVLAMPLAAQTWPDTDPAPTPTTPTLVNPPSDTTIGFPALPGGPASLKSNQSRATAGVFGSEVDDSMNVLWHSADESAENRAFDKWLGFIGYGGDVEYNPIHFGYASRFGSIYVGAWYTGNIAKSFDYSSTKVTNTYSLADQRQTSSKTETTYYSNMTTSNNQLEVLIGVIGMGFKLGFWESMYESKNPDITKINTDDLTGRVEYQNELVDHVNYGGHLRPSLDWGMKIPLGELELRPTASLALDIYQQKQLLDTKIGYTDGVHPIFSSEGTNADYVKPEIGVDVGVAFPSPEKTSMSANVSYKIGFGLYNNDYDVFGYSDTVQGTVKWTGGDNSGTDPTGSYSTKSTTLNSTTTTDQVALNITEVTADLKHNIGLGFYYDNEIFDNFTVGLYTAIPVSIGVDTRDQYTKTFTTVKTKFDRAENGTNTTTSTTASGPTTTTDISTFEVGPYANFGAKYALFPDRFQINAGIHLKPFNFQSTTTKVSQPSTETVTTTTTSKGKTTDKSVTVADTDKTVDSITVENKWSPFEAAFSGGFVFFFNERAAIDLVATYTPTGTSDSNNFEVDAATVNVLVTLKF